MPTITYVNNKLVVTCANVLEASRLSNHDWFYDMSDDYSVAKRGKAAEQELINEFGSELITTIASAMFYGTFGNFETISLEEAQEIQAAIDNECKPVNQEDNMSKSKPEVNTPEYHKAIFGYFRDFCLNYQDKSGRHSKVTFARQLNRTWAGQHELFDNLVSTKKGGVISIRIRKPAYDNHKDAAGRAMRALAEVVRAHPKWEAQFVSGRYSGELQIALKK